MKLPAAALATWLAVTLCPAPAAAAETHQPDDRLILGASGSTLTGASGGGSASVGWLHSVNAGTLIGVGVDYQTIADAHWTFASVTGSLTRGAESSAPLSLYGEIHEGSGRIAGRNFNYSILAIGASRTIAKGLYLQLEDRQIDVDTTHGNLPKLGLSYLWNPRLLTGLSYAHTVGGNLGTELLSARMDYYGKGLNFLAGGAVGQAAPAVFNLQTGVTTPGPTLKQVFLGFAKPYSRAELTLVGDYLDVADSERVTLSLSCIVHLRARGASK
ncbi:MAG: hypothetical protein ACT4O5_02310 [Gammaproteobacteria bacterium]